MVLKLLGFMRVNYEYKGGCNYHGWCVIRVMRVRKAEAMGAVGHVLIPGNISVVVLVRYRKEEPLVGGPVGAASFDNLAARDSMPGFLGGLRFAGMVVSFGCLCWWEEL